MKRKLVYLFLGVLALSALNVGSAFAGSGIVSIDKVEGLVGHDTVYAGQNLRFLFRYDNTGTNGTGQKCDISNGWRISSPDGAVWDSVVLDSAGIITAGENKFLLYFNVTAGLGNFNLGNGAPTPDTIGILAAGSGTKRMPTTWNDTALALIVYFHDATAHNKHICIDSAFYGTGGTWKWVGANVVDYFPAWQGLPGHTYDHNNGGYCFLVWDPLQDVNDGPSKNLPKEFALKQNFPNPFNPVTKIQYEIPTRSHVSLNIYNVLGQKVKTLVNTDQEAKSYSAQWDGTSDTGSKVASGIYFYKIEAGSFTQTKKMILMK
jgi:hypothetical protein